MLYSQVDMSTSTMYVYGGSVVLLVDFLGAIMVRDLCPITMEF